MSYASELKCPHCKKGLKNNSVLYECQLTEEGRLFLDEDGKVGEYKEDDREVEHYKYLCRSCHEELEGAGFDKDGKFFIPPIA